MSRSAYFRARRAPSWPAAEASALWALAMGSAPILRTSFDAAWFDELVARHRAASRAACQGSRQDWGEAPDLAAVHGRLPELDTLRGWIGANRCRVVALLGMGGVGKTMLAARAACELAAEFDRVLLAQPAQRATAERLAEWRDWLHWGPTGIHGRRGDRQPHRAGPLRWLTPFGAHGRRRPRTLEYRRDPWSATYGGGWR
jgi:hypothetical protein